MSERCDLEWMDVNETFSALLDMADLGSTLTSADLVRRIEALNWEVPNLPSSESLVGAGVGLSSALFSSSALSSQSWQRKP
jgi:hypothetical protein